MFSKFVRPIGWLHETPERARELVQVDAVVRLGHGRLLAQHAVLPQDRGGRTGRLRVLVARPLA